MTNQEKWDEIVSKIEELGEELQELHESLVQPSDDIEQSLFGLRLSVDELREQELE
jgi:hypothetical protein